MVAEQFPTQVLQVQGTLIQAAETKSSAPKN